MGEDTDMLTTADLAGGDLEQDTDTPIFDKHDDMLHGTYKGKEYEGQRSFIRHF